MQRNIKDTSTSEARDFMADAARRLTFWGSTTIGVLGVVLAINAGMINEYAQAGACLAASALALGVLGYTFIRK